MPSHPHRIAVLAFDGREPIGEYIVTVKAPNEQRAVDLLAAQLRADLSYQFFGLNRVLVPSVSHV